MRVLTLFIASVLLPATAMGQDVIDLTPKTQIFQRTGGFRAESAVLESVLYALLGFADDGTSKKYVNEKGETKKVRKRDLCYLTWREIGSLVRSTDTKTKIERRFRFSKSCDLDSSINLRMGVNDLDFSLKDRGPFFRLKMTMVLSGAYDKQNKLYSLKTRITDGELYHAADDLYPHIEFDADYAVVLKRKEGVAANPGGKMVIKKHRQNQYKGLPVSLRVERRGGGGVSF